MVLLYLLAAVLAAIGFVVYKLTRVPAGRIPPVVAGAPLIGSAVRFGMDPINLMKEARALHGDVFTLKVFHEHMIFFCGVEAEEFFFKTPEDVFNAAAAYKFTVPLFGKGVVYDGPPELLIEERKIVSRGLSLARFRAYVPMIEHEASEYFLHHWGEQGEADLHKVFNEVTVLTSTACLQGKEVREMVDEFTRLYWTMDASLDSLSFFFPNVPFPKQFKRDQARGRIDQIFKEIIRKRRERLEQHTEEIDNDLLATLMNATLEDGSKLTDDQMVGMIVALLIAGQHTSNVTGAWTGLHLLQHPEAMQRCREELEKSIGGRDAKADFASVKECVFLEYCVRESLRLRPPIITIMRRVLQTTQYRGYDIPEGTLVAVSVAAGNRLSEVWSNPDTFDPERFTREEHKRSPYAFLSFGAGRHACIGESFGVLQTKTIFSWLLRNYDLEYVGHPIEPDFTTMIVSPKPPCMVRYKRRKN